MPTTTEAFAGFRLLVVEPAGNGRRRLLAAAPAQQRHGVWVVSDKAAGGIDRAPCALEHPNGEVTEFATGYRFDSRHDFVRARSGRSP